MSAPRITPGMSDWSDSARLFRVAESLAQQRHALETGRTTEAGRWRKDAEEVAAALAGDAARRWRPHTLRQLAQVMEGGDPPMPKLTRTDRAVLRLVAVFDHRHGRYPNQAELSDFAKEIGGWCPAASGISESVSRLNLPLPPGVPGRRRKN